MMQAYQSPPCPYCGVTWNPPGSQACGNCRNQLPPPQAAYTPPGYGPQGYPPQAYPQPGYPQGYPPAQGGQAQPPQSYPPAGYPGQPGQPYPGYPPQAGYPQPGTYPPGYGQPGQPPAYPGYPTAQAGTPGGSALHLFGRTIAVPFVVPSAVLAYQQQIAYLAIGLVVLLIVILGILPAVASGQVAGAEQGVAAAVGHQTQVDTGFANFFKTDSGSSDPTAIRAEVVKEVKTADDALAAVQADESALKGADQRLAILQVVALPSRATIQHERDRIATALGGLKKADEGLTAASNQGKVLIPLWDATIDFSKMATALAKRDLPTAAAPYPDALQKIELAISLDQAPGVPAGIAKEITAFRDLLNNTESLIQAIQAKDAAATKKYSDLVQAGTKTMSQLSAAVPNDYNAKTYGADQKAYDAALKSLKPSR